MKITEQWFAEHNACKEGMEWVNKYYENRKEIEAAEIVTALRDFNTSWANWVITKVFDKTQCVKYAIFAAEQVLHIFEDKYPEDLRPRKAIEAAKAYLENPCEATRKAAGDAYAAARVSCNIARAACAAGDAGNATVYAATAAVYAGCVAYDAGDATVYAAFYAGYAACDAYATARVSCNIARATYDAGNAAGYAAGAEKIMVKIINYGITLLEKM